MEFKFTDKIHLIELFGGIGSQAMSLRDLNANFIHHRLVEIDKDAVNSYNAIHNTNFEPLDITQVKGKDLEIQKDKQYLLTYSYPCTSLSTAGKGLGMAKDSGTASSLLWQVERLLSETEYLPQVLLMENVKQCHSDKNIKEFQEWINFLSFKGYKSYWKDLTASDFNIPQSRTRCFMISILGEYDYTFPSNIEKTNNFWNFAFDDNSICKEYKISNQNVLTRLHNSLLNQKTEEIIINGQTFKKGLYDVYNKRFRTDDICGTLTANGNIGSTQCSTFGKVLVNKDGSIEIYKLSPLEEWRLMGYTDTDFEKAKALHKNPKLYKQAGNAIVKQCMMEIFKKLLP